MSRCRSFFEFIEWYKNTLNRAIIFDRQLNYDIDLALYSLLDDQKEHIAEWFIDLQFKYYNDHESINDQLIAWFEQGSLTSKDILGKTISLLITSGEARIYNDTAKLFNEGCESWDYYINNLN